MTYFTAYQAPLIDLKIIQRDQKKDSRGYFSRLFCPNELKSSGWHDGVFQINESFTESKGTVRGMHYQKHPWNEAKIVSCVRGKIFDVAIDLRPNSPTYLKWHGVELSSDNAKAMLIPEGYAHGFQSLSDDVLLIYAHSKLYNSDASTGINPFDPKIAIKWPIAVGHVSCGDRELPFIDRDFGGV